MVVQNETILRGSVKGDGEQMSIPMVLMIGSSELDFASVRRHLEDQGCDCRFASSYTEGVELFSQLRFDLILSSGMPGIRNLASSFRGLPVSVFCSHPIEDSCLWLPVLVKGKECLGAPALHPKEFSKKLDQMLDELGPHPRKHSQSHNTLWHA